MTQHLYSVWFHCGCINQTLQIILPFWKRREDPLFMIFQYVFKMFSLLAVIPRGSESPFLAARLRRCWAWNPINGAGMPALWHQTPSMQNATTGVHQQLSLQLTRCRGVQWWMTWLTRVRGDDTRDTDVGQNGECSMKWGMREDRWERVKVASNYIWTTGKRSGE